ncbi:MAG: sugar kinase [Acholeplasmatales bacterium]|jgi:2-dehydro-3-deoxygluconokinase|nr:sugar kinase [Acholeplasmatales bacterium]
MKVVTFGEIMLRLSPASLERLVQAKALEVVYGGGEANVAVSLANYGHEAYFVTKLPKHEIGESALNELRRYGVNTSYIARGGERLGIYYLETGASLRPSKVIYDRSHSAISEAKPQDFDFKKIFKGASWFHWSGITPALSPQVAKILEAACIEAKAQGLKISVDLNYRKKLWSPEEAQKVMIPLMKYVDVCIGNEEDAEKVLGFKSGSNIEHGELNVEGYKNSFLAMRKQFGFKVIATTLRQSHSATHNTWSALILADDFYQSRKYEINPIVDRVGGGDSFSGGLIHGLLTTDYKNALEFAVAASALKHTISGDFNHASEEEVLALCGGDTSGRVQR